MEARVSKLENDMSDIKVILARMDGRLDRINDRFDRIDDRFDRVDDRFGQVNDRFDHVATKEDLLRSETRIEVTLGRMDERLAFRATKEDIAKLATSKDVARVGERIARVEGTLEGKLGVWQFLTVMGVAVALILAWPRLSVLLGLS